MRMKYLKMISLSAITLGIFYSLFAFSHQGKVLILKGHLAPQLKGVASPQNGRVKKILVKNRDSIKKGEKIIELENETLEYEIKKAERNIKLLDEQLKYKEKELEALGIFYAIPENALYLQAKELEGALNKEKDMLVYLRRVGDAVKFVVSDIEGIVVFDEDEIDEGGTVKEGNVVFIVINVNKWYLYLAPRETDLLNFKKGQRVEIYCLNDMFEKFGHLNAAINSVNTSFFGDPLDNLGMNTAKYTVRLTIEVDAAFINEYLSSEAILKGFQIECKVFENEK